MTNNSEQLQIRESNSPKIKKSAIILISVGLLNFVHGMLHIIQFAQSMLLIAYSTESHDHQDKSFLDNLLHNPILAFIWAIIGLLTFIIGLKDFLHHRKHGHSHKH